MGRQTTVKMLPNYVKRTTRQIVTTVKETPRISGQLSE